MADWIGVDVRQRTRTIAQRLRADDVPAWSECTSCTPGGKFCGRPVPPDAPASLCGRCIARVYLWCEDQAATYIDNNDTMPKTVAVLRTLADQHRLEQAAGKAVVYYVQIGEYIKIGTTYRMTDRMRQLGKPTVLATEEGHYMLEASRHQQFAHRRAAYGREYFHPAPDLLAHIERVRAKASA